jgi:intergrase/recombinase
MARSKVPAWLYISMEVLETARRSGLNLSRVSENALVEAIRRLDVPEAGKEAAGSPGLLVRGVGFGPTNPCGIAASGRDAANRSLHDGEVDWDKFRAWAYKEYRPFTARDRFFHAKKYARCLASGDLSELAMLNDCQRVHALKALTSLSKFLGVCEDWRRLVRSYGLKCTDRNSDDLIIGRLTKAVNADDIFEWIRKVKSCAPELSEFMDLLAATGLRLNEAVECHNLIIDLAPQGRLGDYYKADRRVLEHFRFKETFLRGSKKAFISFAPAELVGRISRGGKLEYGRVQKLATNRVGRQRFADVRELHGTLMTKWLRESEIDFLHGRVSSSVFMRNYFNPAWIGDLEGRAIRGIKRIMEKMCPAR